MGNTRKGVKTNIASHLWIKAGGRCEYRGCNKLLYKDELKQKDMNAAYIAHIVAVSPDGCRGDPVKSKLLENEPSNIMLLCDPCHRRIDYTECAQHTVEVLQQMKKEHEDRVELLTGIIPNKKSQVVIYTARIGSEDVSISFSDAANAMVMHRYPVNDKPIFLGLGNSIDQDHTQEYWSLQLRQLETSFTLKVVPLLATEINHFSVFAFAPQPLLIKLGTMLTDKYPADIFQFCRSSASWVREDNSGDEEFICKIPESCSGTPILLLSLSGSINRDNIKTKFSGDFSLYELTIEQPSPGIQKSKSTLNKFKECARLLLNKISEAHGGSPLHVFPAMPIAAALEFGRLRLPKVDMPLVIYDFNQKTNGWMQAIEIKN